MADHHKGRPNTVELYHPALDRTIHTSPGAARVLKSSGWVEPADEPTPEVAAPATVFRPEEDI